MTYLEIRNLLKQNHLEDSISLDIVSAVSCTVPENVTDEEFEILCRYVRHIWDRCERTYTQLIADVVIDCVYHCYNYYQCDSINLTFDDMKNYYTPVSDDVIEAYLSKYYDC